MAFLVERMLELQRRLPAARTPPLAEPAFAKHPHGTSRPRLYRRLETPIEKEMLQRELQATDQAINGLVYQLFGLSEEEIKLVEAK